MTKTTKNKEKAIYKIFQKQGYQIELPESWDFSQLTEGGFVDVGEEENELRLVHAHTCPTTTHKQQAWLRSMFSRIYETRRLRMEVNNPHFSAEVMLVTGDFVSRYQRGYPSIVGEPKTYHNYCLASIILDDVDGLCFWMVFPKQDVASISIFGHITGSAKKLRRDEVQL